MSHEVKGTTVVWTLQRIQKGVTDDPCSSGSLQSIRVNLKITIDDETEWPITGAPESQKQSSGENITSDVP